MTTADDLCRDSLDGLSVGDALGAQFFVPGTSLAQLAVGRLPPPWPWTDDTEMACSVAVETRRTGGVDQDRLAASFGEHFEPYRGYGGGAVVLLRQMAVAAAEAGRARAERRRPEPAELLDTVLDHLVDSRVTAGIERARRLLGADAGEAAYELGNGARVLAQDTVPFTLWTAATFLHDYPAAILTCIRAGGDVDTTAAIVGGIVATFTGTGPGGIPGDWLAAREPLPDRST
ncbi:ADP-ribosylglycohydrolase family protein [Cryptosporangium japonicum]|uniref:ADP-ribosylglycohydrolase n=1 Tax=Cryptosporangium japonicum TaxID=80872 RepID=A0ABP3D559_9ACTN